MNTASAVTSKSYGYSDRRIGDHFRKTWSLYAWSAVLLVINLPVLWGEVRTGLLFLPDAVITGEWWRIVTFPLVHLSWYHFLLDAGGFLLLYSALEEKRKVIKTLYILGPGLGTLMLTLALSPAVSTQGLSGLSGIAHGLMAVTALEMINDKSQRTWGVVSLVTIVLKSAYELWSGHVLFEFMHMGLCGLPLTASHAGGVAGGLLTFALIRATAEIKTYAVQLGRRKR